MEAQEQIGTAEALLNAVEQYIKFNKYYLIREHN